MKTQAMIYTDCVYHSHSEPIILYDQYKDVVSFRDLASKFDTIFFDWSSVQVPTEEQISSSCRVLTNIQKSFPPEKFFTDFFPFKRSYPTNTDRMISLHYGGDLHPNQFKIKKHVIEYAGQIESDGFGVFHHFAPFYINYETGCALARLYKTPFDEILSMEHYLTMASMIVVWRKANVRGNDERQPEHTHQYFITTLADFMSNQISVDIVDRQGNTYTTQIPERIRATFDQMNIPEDLRCNPDRLRYLFADNILNSGLPYIWLLNFLRSLMDYGHMTTIISFEVNSDGYFTSGKLHNDWTGMFNGTYGFPVDPSLCILKITKNSVFKHFNAWPYNREGVNINEYRDKICDQLMTQQVTITLLENIKKWAATPALQSIHDSLLRVAFYNLSPIEKGHYFEFVKRVATEGFKKFGATTFDNAVAHLIWGLSNSTINVNDNTGTTRYTSRKRIPYNIEGDFAYDAAADPNILDAYTQCLNDGFLKLCTYNRPITYKASGHPNMLFVYPTRGTYLKFTTHIKFDFKTKFWFMNDFNNKKVKYPVLTDAARTWFSEKCPGLFLGDIDFMSKKEGTMIEL